MSLSAYDPSEILHCLSISPLLASLASSLTPHKPYTPQGPLHSHVLFHLHECLSFCSSPGEVLLLLHILFPAQEPSPTAPGPAEPVLLSFPHACSRPFFQPPRHFSYVCVQVVPLLRGQGLCCPCLPSTAHRPGRLC